MSPAPAPAIVVRRGGVPGTSVPLTGDSGSLVLGSAPDCQIPLLLTNVESIHARVQWEAGSVLLMDEGSVFGTFVNGEAVQGARPLQPGDVISLGEPGDANSAELAVEGGEAGAILLDDAPVLVEPELEVTPDAPALDLGGGESLSLGGDAILLGGDEGPAPPGDEGSAIALEGEGAPPIELAPAAPAAAAPPPAPDAAAPSAPARPAAPERPAIVFDEPPPAPPPAKAEGKARPRPEYTHDLPSMVSEDRPREPVAVSSPAAPPVARPAAPRNAAAPAKRRVSITVPRWAILAAVVLVVLGAGFLAYRMLAAPPPVLSSVTPPRVEPGSAVTLNGTGLQGASAVRVGGGTAAIVSRTDTQVVATLPAGTPYGADVPVLVESGGTKSNALFVRVVRFPKVQALAPDVALGGQEVVLRGAALKGKAVSVRINNLDAPVVASSDTELRVRVPVLSVPEGRAVDVAVQVDGEHERAPQLLIGRLPLLAGAEPASGPAGTRVTLSGRGFDPSPEGTVVAFGAQRALLLSATDRQLVVTVPPAPEPGSAVIAPVAVTVGPGTSAEVPFTITRESVAGLRLRFFPSRGDAAHEVLVATEIAPVLALAGRGAAPSVAERAARVADALTSAAASGGAATVAARDAAVTIDGKAVATATTEDADGYARRSGRGARGTPRQVASLWAALLHDYLGLAAGVRPVRTAELTDRARVLLDFHADIERAGGPGRAGPPSPERRQLLRELALSLPAGPVSGVAVAGRWEGTLEESDEPRPTRLEFTAAGGGLSGFLNSRAGQIDMRVPLRDVRYTGGQLSFTVVMGGVPRTFRGRIEGVEMKGTIHPEGRPEEIGRFTVRHLG